MQQSKVPAAQKRGWLIGAGIGALALVVSLTALPGRTVAQKDAPNSQPRAVAPQTNNAVPSLDRDWDSYKGLVERNAFRPLVTKSKNTPRPGDEIGMLPPLTLDVVPRTSADPARTQASSGWAFVGSVSIEGQQFALLENRRQGLGGYYLPGDELPLGVVESISNEFVHIKTNRNPIILPLTSGDTVQGARPSRPAAPGSRPAAPGSRPENTGSPEDQLLEALSAILPPAGGQEARPPGGNIPFGEGRAMGPGAGIRGQGREGRVNRPGAGGDGDRTERARRFMENR
jgi:hypothetical protein